MLFVSGEKKNRNPCQEDTHGSETEINAMLRVIVCPVNGACGTRRREKGKGCEEPVIRSPEGLVALALSGPDELELAGEMVCFDWSYSAVGLPLLLQCKHS